MSSSIILIYSIALLSLLLIIILGKLETRNGKIVDVCISDIANYKYKDINLREKLSQKFTFFRWKKLVVKLINEGYQPEKYGYITITDKDIVINGDHRLACMKYVFDDKKRIKIMRIKHNNWYRYSIKILYIPLICFLPAILLYPVMIFISRYD